MAAQEIETRPSRDLSLPVVCIGMSAGSLVPLRVLFRRLNPNTGMAFVVIHHVRRVPTQLPQILSRCTIMPVELAAPGVALRPNRVYILPSGTQMSLADGYFSIRPRARIWGHTNVLTLFLESLARSEHPGIAVILSGLDADGAQALEAFRKHGGITVVQEPRTAASPEMPSAALETGCVNYSLPPASIPRHLEEFAKYFKRWGQLPASAVLSQEEVKP